MPSKNKKQEFKAKLESSPQRDGIDQCTVGNGVANGVSDAVSPLEVYFKILNHITSGNILNEKENIKHKAFLSHVEKRSR